MPTKRLTQKTVENTSPPDSGRLELWDDVTPGLVLRITPSGSRTYAVMTRLRGERVRVTLGKASVLKLSDARTKAREVIAAAEAGKDPRPKKDGARATTVAALAEDFLTRYCGPSLRASTATEYARYLRKHVVPTWGKRDVAEIRKRDVVLLIDKIGASGAPYAANRCLATISKFFSWLASRDIIETSPVIGISRPTSEKARDRVLTDEELRLVWNACEGLTPAYRDFVRCLILTAQRREEVATMSWSHTDPVAQTWTIPGDLAKNQTASIVPLTDMVCEMLEGMLVHDDCDFVFTTNGRVPISGFSKLKAGLDARIAEVLGETKTMPPWRFHDLRRTAATGMARLGVPRLHIEKVLNHTERSVTGRVYERHRYDNEKRQALNLWATHVADLATEQSPRIVPFSA